jgi:N-acetylglucosamine-6-phosphate deacetylase
MPEGQYMLGSLEVEVREGKCLHDGKLAGSVLTLDGAVRNAMEFAGLDVQQSVRLASLNPARTVKVDRGTLQAGSAADLVALSPSGEVKATIVNGVLAQ